MAITKTGEILTKEAGLFRIATRMGTKFLNSFKGVPSGQKKTLGQKVARLFWTPKNEMGPILDKKMSPKEDFLSLPSLGFMAYDMSSGNSSPGEAIGGAGVSSLAYGLSSKIPGLRRLGTIGRLATGIVAGSLGYDYGRKLGRKVNPKRRVHPYQEKLRRDFGLVDKGEGENIRLAFKN